jgi:hypothetical protein
MADQLIKVDYDDIWDSDKHNSSQKRGSLYRGNSQKMFERRVIESMMDSEPTYWGTENEQGKLTFCSPEYLGALSYADYWLNKHEYDFELEKSNRFPHTFYPLMMEIKAENYKDRIYRSTTGEGLAIRGPINLDDITILYSTQIDKYMESHPSHQDLPKDGYLQKFKDALDKSISSKGMEKDDLLDAYAKSPDEVTGLMLFWYHGRDRSRAKPEQIEAIARSMETLRAKLR